MRVVGGEARGRPLRAPAGRGTRPTSDRVREAIFDILGSLVELDAARVVDLFAGSGALGIEALSRGAASAVLVERDPVVGRIAHANLEALGYADEGSTVAGADAVRWAEACGRGGPATDDGLDVVFADPPYRWARWPRLLAALEPWADVLVAETGGPLDVGHEWTLLRQRTYGATVVTVASPIRLKGGT